MAGGITTLTLGHKADLKSAKAVVDLYKAQHSSSPIIFLSDKPFSSMFYTGGKAINIDTVDEINKISKNNLVYIAVKKSQLSRLNNEPISLKIIGDAGSYRLYQIN